MSIYALVKQAELPFVEFSEVFSTEIKIRKIALVAISAVSALLACGTFSAILIGTFSFSFSLVSLPFFSISFLSFKASTRLKNYEDPLELYAMKEEAKCMSFSELIEEYQEIDSILSHNIVDLLILRSKFNLECDGKSLSEILAKTPLSYIRKYDLMTKESLKMLFQEELSEIVDIFDLFDRLKDLGELKKFEVISVENYEFFESLYKQEETIQVEKRSSLISLNTRFLGRRECILADLERKEKRTKEELQKSYSQKIPVSFSFIRNLQGQLKSIQEEKIRVQNDESIGLDLQKEYDQMTTEVYKAFEEKQRKIREQFRKFVF